MQLAIEIDGTPRTLSIRRAGDAFAITIGGQERIVRAGRVDAHTLALVIEDAAAGGDGTPRLSSHEAVIVSAAGAADGRLDVRIGADTFSALIGTPRRRGRGDDSGPAGSGPQRIVAPMPGKIVRILAQPGDAVAPRQPVIVIEAMKMENELRSSGAGTVAEVPVREGQSVDAGTLLAVITPAG